MAQQQEIWKELDEIETAVPRIGAKKAAAKKQRKPYTPRMDADTHARVQEALDAKNERYGYRAYELLGKKGGYVLARKYTPDGDIARKRPTLFVLTQAGKLAPARLHRCNAAGKIVRR